MSANIKVATNNIQLTEAFQQFQTSNRARNLTEKTINNYEQNRDMLLKFKGGDFALEEITKDFVIKYIEFLKKRNCKAVTINSRLRALKRFISYSNEMGYMDKIKIEMLKEDTPIKETYTEAELKILLKKPDLRTCGFDDLRTWAAENFLIGTGARLSSVINIKMGDLYLDDNEVILRQMKGRQQVILPISSSLKTVLVQYIQYRKPQKDDDYLFPTWHGKKITESGFKNSVKRYNRRKGITKTGIHMFRYTFAKMCILSGMDAFRLMRLMNHKSISITNGYISLFAQDLKINYEEFNPLNNLSKSKKHIKIGQ